LQTVALQLVGYTTHIILCAKCHQAFCYQQGVKVTSKRRFKDRNLWIQPRRFHGRDRCEMANSNNTNWEQGSEGNPTHSHPVPRLRMSGAIALFPLHAFMSWTGTTLSLLKERWPLFLWRSQSFIENVSWFRSHYTVQAHGYAALIPY